MLYIKRMIQGILICILADTTQICERKTGTISCLTIQGTRLYITNATYGRTSKNICKHRREGRTSNTDCRANSLSVVRKLCQNKTFCKLKPTNKVFSDPCSGTYKYLELMFECKLVGKSTAIMLNIWRS